MLQGKLYFQVTSSSYSVDLWFWLWPSDAIRSTVCVHNTWTICSKQAKGSQFNCNDGEIVVIPAIMACEKSVVDPISAAYRSTSLDDNFTNSRLNMRFFMTNGSIIVGWLERFSETIDDKTSLTAHAAIGGS